MEKLIRVSLILHLLVPHAVSILAHEDNETITPFMYQKFVKLAERLRDVSRDSHTTYSSSHSGVNTTWACHAQVLDRIAVEASSLPSPLTSVSNHTDEARKMNVLRKDRLERDKERVKAILQVVRKAQERSFLFAEPLDQHHHARHHKRLLPPIASEENTTTTSTTMNSETEISSRVSSGESLGSGEYLTEIGIGTPPLLTHMILDTGSDLTWLQCEPCNRCYPQRDPIFLPSASASFELLPCGSALCGGLPLHTCIQSACMYEVLYGDGSFSLGDLVMETLTFSGGTKVPAVGMGCGHNNEGRFSTAATGLLGLGAGTTSLPSQLQSDFAYCLPNMGYGGGTLAFGKSTIDSLRTTAATTTNMEQQESITTPLLRNPIMDTFYYVELEGISVGGRRLAISSDVWGLSEDGEGGVVVDSGTTVTRLEQVAYDALREAFREATTDLMLVDGGMEIFDTCYDLSGIESIEVPTIELHLVEVGAENHTDRAGIEPQAVSNATISLPAANYLVGIDDESMTYCLAFAPSRGMSILGNIQQQGFLLSFSSTSGRLAFTPDYC